MTRTILFATIIAVMALSSWLMTRKARRILSRSLGRDVRAGEENSLRAWMAVPDAELDAAPRAMGENAAERVLDALESRSRAMPGPARHDDLSIR